MRALIADRLPGKWLSVAALLTRSRPGLAAGGDMPHIERGVTQARIDPEWLRRYEACIGLGGRRAGGLPPLALQIAAAPLHLAIMADPAFPFRALGLIHQSQRIEQARELDPLSPYDLLAYTTQAREERRGTSFALVTEARREGAVVWRSDIRALAVTRAKVLPAGHARSDAALDGLHPLSSETIDVPESMGRRYARIAGDVNPVHMHALLARPFGFRRAIVHGTWTLARAMAGAGWPARPCFSLEAQFRRPVELPSRIVVTRYADGSGSEVALRVSDADAERTLLLACLDKPRGTQGIE